MSLPITSHCWPGAGGVARRAFARHRDARCQFVRGTARGERLSGDLRCHYRRGYQSQRTLLGRLWQTCGGAGVELALVAWPTGAKTEMGSDRK